MNPEEMKQKAIDLFMKRFHCSQAVMAVGQEKLGDINEAVTKAMGLFGGGLAGTGNVCGALLGGVAVISCMYSRGNLNEKENPRMWRLGQKLAQKFEGLTQAHGGIDCKDISKVDWKNADSAKEFYANPESRRKICMQLVGDVAQILGEMIEEETSGKK